MRVTLHMNTRCSRKHLMDSDHTPVPSGDCFEAALKFLQQPGVTKWPDDYRLVHGNTAALRQDEAVNHAWVEEGDIVHEVSGGRDLVYSKVAYYKKHQITNVRRYTVLEALELAVKNGHWGPWD